MVEILVPHQGIQQELIEMAAENAAETLRSLQAQWETDRVRQEQSMAELREALELAKFTQSDRVLRHFEYPGYRCGGQHGCL